MKRGYLIDTHAEQVTIAPTVDEAGARVISIDTGDGIEMRIHGGSAQLQRLALAFAAAVDGDVPDAS